MCFQDGNFRGSGHWEWDQGAKEASWTKWDLQPGQKNRQGPEPFYCRNNFT